MKYSHSNKKWGWQLQSEVEWRESNEQQTNFISDEFDLDYGWNSCIFSYKYYWSGICFLAESSDFYEKSK